MNELMTLISYVAVAGFCVFIINILIGRTENASDKSHYLTIAGALVLVFGLISGGIAAGIDYKASLPKITPNKSVIAVPGNALNISELVTDENNTHPQIKAAYWADGGCDDLKITDNTLIVCGDPESGSVIKVLVFASGRNSAFSEYDMQEVLVTVHNPK